MSLDPMTIFVAYDVIEHSPDNSWAPEPFGTYLHTGPSVRRNDIILLKWLDGREAYGVRVGHIHNGTLHVMRIEDES